MTTPSTRSVAKDFYKLQKNIHSFSNGEARVVSFDDELTRFEVELNIKDGYYKDGIFVFEVRIDKVKYPIEPPTVWFNSQIFHPNIGDGYEEGLVCLNLLSEDWQTNDLEDVVQGMLFLIKNPALDDALNPLFSCLENFDVYMENFTKLVRQSLEGGEVEGVEFERNPGLVQKDKMLEESKMSNQENPPDIAQRGSETTNSTIDPENPALALCTNLHFPICKTAMNISSKDELYCCGLYWVYSNFTKFSTNGKSVYGRGNCPKWLTKLAVLMFGGARRKENVNIFSRNLRTFERFPFLGRTLTWRK